LSEFEERGLSGYFIKNVTVDRRFQVLPDSTPLEFSNQAIKDKKAFFF